MTKNDTAKKILEYPDEGFIGCIIEGERGHGMSMYYIKERLIKNGRD